MKKIFYAASIVLVTFILSSCTNTTDNPVNSSPTTGGVWVMSTPQGAQIWVDGNNSNKTTNDSVTALSTGSHDVTLKLSGYRDTTVSVNVTAGVNLQINVVLTSTLSTKAFGPVQIYEITGTTASQPSGIILKNGTASGIGSSAPNRDSVDMFYYSNSNSTEYDVRSADLASSLSRATFFYQGSSANIYDGVSSPAKDASWTKKISDTVTTKYYFVLDQDNHYSKLKIDSYGGGSGPGDPAWVKVVWIYNNKAADYRFPTK